MDRDSLRAAADTVLDKLRALYTGGRLWMPGFGVMAAGLVLMLVSGPIGRRLGRRAGLSDMAVMLLRFLALITLTLGAALALRLIALPG